MPVTEAGYLCVADRLGLHVPNSFAVLPDNFAQAISGRDFRLGAEAPFVRALFQDCQLTLENFTRGDESGLAELQAVSDHLKGQSPRRSISLSLIVERSSDRMCRKLTCEDDISGFAALAVKAARIADM